jgi:hypothetical protein
MAATSFASTPRFWHKESTPNQKNKKPLSKRAAFVTANLLQKTAIGLT